MKDITKKVVKADSELEKQSETLPHIAQTAKLESEQISASAAGLDKALTAFQSEQLALGAEMGILLATNSSDLTFNLPKATASIDIGGDRPIPIAASGALSRTSAQSGNNQFSFKLIADLSELQPEVTAILRSQLNRSPRCGDRLEIVQATLTPSDPAALVVANVHHERWICPSSSKENAMEVDDSNGVVEITLTPFVEQNGALRLAGQISSVTADKSLHDLLRSGDLGVLLRDQIAAAILSPLQKAADLKAALPQVARESAILQKAQFQNAGADRLNLELEGQLNLSDEQLTQLATQLKQPLSAQGKSP